MTITDISIGALNRAFRFLYNKICCLAGRVKTLEEGGGGGGAARFGIEDNIGVQNRSIALGDFQFYQTAGDSVDYLLLESEILLKKQGIFLYSQNENATENISLTLQGQFGNGLNVESQSVNGNAAIRVQTGVSGINSSSLDNNLQSLVEASGGTVNNEVVNISNNLRRALFLESGTNSARIRKSSYLTSTVISDLIFPDINTSQFIPLSVDGNFANASGNIVSRPYKVYTALLTQSGTSAPVATILENTLSGTPIWSYDGIGTYGITLTGIFLLAKTIFYIGSAHDGDTSSNAQIAGFRRENNDQAVVVVSSESTNTPINNSLRGTMVEIRVYN